jgi:hypothetical protein
MYHPKHWQNKLQKFRKKKKMDETLLDIHITFSKSFFIYIYRSLKMKTKIKSNTRICIYTKNILNG